MNFKTQHKLTIGLTGNILCGKSAVLAAWKKAGAFVLSCDDLVREISVRPAMQLQIQKIFGRASREQLAAHIFADEGLRKQLEGILHPALSREIKKRLVASTARVRVVEVPLLFEVNWQAAFDLTVAVVADEKVLAARAVKRGIKKADFLKRYRTQLPQQVKATRADICIVNEGTLMQLNHKISALQQALETIYS